MRILNYDDLKPEKGICYSKVQLWRLEKTGEFPKRVPLGRGRHGWAEHEINEWIRSRIAVRDSAANAQ
jgi:prophage regulatory protein